MSKIPKELERIPVGEIAKLYHQFNNASVSDGIKGLELWASRWGLTDSQALEAFRIAKLLNGGSDGMEKTNRPFLRP